MAALFVRCVRPVCVLAALLCVGRPVCVLAALFVRSVRPVCVLAALSVLCVRPVCVLAALSVLCVRLVCACWPPCSGGGQFNFSTMHLHSNNCIIFVKLRRFTIMRVVLIVVFS